MVRKPKKNRKFRKSLNKIDLPICIIETTGVGKSKFLEFLIQHHIGRNGFGVVGPNGDLTSDIEGFLCSKLKEMKKEYSKREAGRF